MKHIITEIQIIPIKPQNGLLAFCSFILDENIYLGSIGIVTKLTGGYRLVYPTKKVGDKSLNVFYPINREFAQYIEQEVIEKFESIMNNNDRHNSFSA